MPQSVFTILLEAVAFSVMPYHSSRVDFLFERMEGTCTGENNQDELNSSVLSLICMHT